MFDLSSLTVGLLAGVALLSLFIHRASSVRRHSSRASVIVAPMATRGPTLSRLERWSFWLATWFVALFFLVPARGLGTAVVGWVFFPCGLAPEWNWRPDSIHLTCWGFGWALYVVLSLFALTARRAWVYFVLWGILIITLVVDVWGCLTLLDQWAREPFAT
jgi:hypothetical protein